MGRHATLWCLLLLAALASGFYPSSQLRNRHPGGTDLQVGTEADVLVFESEEFFDDGGSSDRTKGRGRRSFLRFDAAAGRIEFGDDEGGATAVGTLLEGVDGVAWSAEGVASATATARGNSDSSALILRASRPGAAEHRAVLGDLASCRRLLACSSA